MDVCPQVKVYDFYQRSEEEDDWRGTFPFVCLKSRAQEVNKVVSFLYYLFVSLHTTEARGSVGSGAVGKGFGAWVRIPGPPIISCYFSSDVQARTQGQRITMCPQDPTIGSPDGQI